MDTSKWKTMKRLGQGKVLLAALTLAGVSTAGWAARASDFISATPPSTVLISANTLGQPGNGDSTPDAMTPDGRYVLFNSLATDLMSIPSPSSGENFVRDRDVNGDGRLDEPGNTKTVMVSVSPSGQPAEGQDVGGGDISADGRFVAWTCDCPNFYTPPIPKGVFVPNEIFLHDRDPDENGVFDEPGKTTTRVISTNTVGEMADGYFSQWPSLSADGHYLAFASDADNLVSQPVAEGSNVYVKDTRTGGVTLVSQAFDGGVATDASSLFSNGSASSISSDGRYVVFESDATNLVRGIKPTYRQIYRRDLFTGATTLVSAAPDGQPGDGLSYDAIVSANGRYVSFSSRASNLSLFPTHIPAVPSEHYYGSNRVFVKDMQSGAMSLVSNLPASPANSPDYAGSLNEGISADGRYVVVSGGLVDGPPGCSTVGNNLYVRDTVAGSVWCAAPGSVVKEPALTGGFPPIAILSVTTVGIISGDGSQLAFNSDSLLIPGQNPNGSTWQAYVRQAGYACADSSCDPVH